MSTIEELQAMGAFVPDELVQRTLRFKLGAEGDEQEATVFVRRLSIGAQESVFKKSDDPDVGYSVKMICAAIRLGEKGEQLIPLAMSKQLHPAIATAMLDAISEVSDAKIKN